MNVANTCGSGEDRLIALLEKTLVQLYFQDSGALFRGVSGTHGSSKVRVYAGFVIGYRSAYYFSTRWIRFESCTNRLRSGAVILCQIQRHSQTHNMGPWFCLGLVRYGLNRRACNRFSFTTTVLCSKVNRTREFTFKNSNKMSLLFVYFF